MITGNMAGFNIAEAASRLTAFEKKFVAIALNNSADKKVLIHGLGNLAGPTAVAVGVIVSYDYWNGEGLVVRACGREFTFRYAKSSEKMIVVNDNPHLCIL